MGWERGATALTVLFRSDDWLVEYNGMGERRHRLYCTVSVRGLASGIQRDGREASPPLLYCFCQMTG